jgi:hypothetical protein
MGIYKGKERNLMRGLPICPINSIKNFRKLLILLGVYLRGAKAPKPKNGNL